VPHSGIYRCMGCGREVVAEESRKLPPQNHHEHSSAQGKIRWRMIVYADHKPK
jgi:DNA-directed RNA polymerase subunit RPC12/RpoP